MADFVDAFEWRYEVALVNWVTLFVVAVTTRAPASSKATGRAGVCVLKAARTTRSGTKCRPYRNVSLP